MSYQASKYTPREELANACSHGLGVILSLAGLAGLVAAALRLGGGAHRLVPCIIYGILMLLMFLVSTLYHSFRSPRLKRVFRVLDHEMIFLMIAGTYTPFTLLVLDGVFGWTLFGIIWGLAIIGLFFQGFFTGRFAIVSTLLYILMGWVIVFAMKPLIDAMPVAGIHWLWAGGLCYTLGAVVYLLKKIPYHHAVWHLAVLAGAACHYIAILRYALT